MGSKRPKYIQVKLREKDAAFLIDLLEDELADEEAAGDPEYENETRAYERALDEIKSGLWRLERHLDRISAIFSDDKKVEPE